MAPRLVKWDEEHRSRGLVVIDVHTGIIDSAEAVKGYVEKKKYRFAVAQDADDVICDAYEVLQFPQAYLIGVDGTVKWVGQPKPNDPVMLKAVADEVAKSKYTSSTKPSASALRLAPRPAIGKVTYFRNHSVVVNVVGAIRTFMDVTRDFSLEARSRKPDGSLVLQLVFSRVHGSQNAGFGPANFDSKKKETGRLTPQVAALMSLVGVPLEVVLASNGELVAIGGFPERSKRFGPIEKSVKADLEGFFIPFPKDGVKAGQAWTWTRSAQAAGVPATLDLEMTVGEVTNEKLLLAGKGSIQKRGVERTQPLPATLVATTIKSSKMTLQSELSAVDHMPRQMTFVGTAQIQAPGRGGNGLVEVGISIRSTLERTAKPGASEKK